jgi:hypothetical protein
MYKKMLIVSLLVLLTLGVASASENITDDVFMDEQTIDVDQNQDVGEVENSVNDSSSSIDDTKIPVDTKIETKNVNAYYKESSDLVGYLKDTNNNPISNKNVSITINNKIYNRISDNNGKVVLKINFCLRSLAILR